MIPGLDLADRPARVLIVDDKRQNRDLLEVMLAPEGYVLLTAASGEDALAIVDQQAPDLILLDVRMPDIDGCEVARRIKSKSSSKNIPVVMVTAFGDHDARMLGLSAGAEDFLTKPVDRAELCMRVRNLLRLRAYGAYYDKYSQYFQMPDADGFTLAAAIKQDPSIAGATIVMLTSAGKPGDAARCREAGIAAYLPKPIKRSDLRAAILSALGTRPARERPALVTRHSLREARHTGRILLVEDDQLNQRIAREVLEKRGHTVVVANNGLENSE